MANKRLKYILINALGLCALVLCNRCSTGIVPSPEAGILKITLHADPSDTLIVVAGDTLRTVVGDSYHVKIYQGKAFDQDGRFAVLYQNTSEYYEVEHHYNLLQRENGVYKVYTLFQSYLPPDHYAKIKFGMLANFVLFTRGYAYGGIGIPMETPAGKTPFVEFDVNFTVEEDRTTEIKLEIKPLQSVVRYKDIFHFVPNISIQSVGTPD